MKDSLLLPLLMIANQISQFGDVTASQPLKDRLFRLPTVATQLPKCAHVYHFVLVISPRLFCDFYCKNVIEESDILSEEYVPLREYFKSSGDVSDEISENET